MKNLIFLAFISLAQAQSINVQSFSPSHSHNFTYTQETLKTRGSLFTNSNIFFSSSLGTNQSPLQNSQNINVINRIDTLDLRAGYLFDGKHYLGLSTSVNKVNMQTQNESDWTLGDSNAVYIYQLPFTIAGVQLAISPQLILPTGDKDLLLSDSSLGGQFSVIAQKNYNAWELAGNAGYRYTDSAKTQNLKQYHRVVSSIGLNYYINDKFSIGPEFYQEYTLDKSEDNFLKFTSINSHYAIAKNARVYAAIGSGNLRDFTDDRFRVMVGLKISAPNTVLTPMPEMYQVKAREEKVHSVYFARNSTQLSAEYKSQLKELSRKLLPEQKIRLSGQADRSGVDDYNTLLSKRRALAVKNYLKEIGVTNSFIQTSALVDGELRKVDIVIE